MASAAAIKQAGKELAALHARNPKDVAAATRKKARAIGCTAKELRDAMWAVINGKRDGMSVEQHLTAALKRHRWGFPL